ncbi:MAG TPA: glycosyltransferase family 4 protein, partial [Roseiarcus sp.]
GGISRYCRYQIQALRENHGAERVTVLSLLGPDQNGFEEPFAVSWRGGSRASLRLRVMFALVAAFTALRCRPHVVHIAHVNYTPLALLLGWMVGARTVLNVYGLEIWSGLSWLRRQAMRRMDRVIADCHFTANYVVKDALHDQRPTVIWDCVDLQRFRPAACSHQTLAKYGIPDKREAFVVLTLGRLAKGAAHKGYDRLIDAFARLQAEVAEAFLVVAGRGALLPELEAQARRLGVEKRVRFIGAVDEADLPDVYRAATIFSLVSDRGHKRGEGIPLTPLEAMACGTPIIVGDHDGSQEAIADRSNGFVVDPFDIARHAAILAEVAQNDALRERFAAGARKVAEGQFGFDEFRSKHLRCYLTIGAKAPLPSAREP